ncbi:MULTISPECIES: DUF4158 domain-containing protein [unclassified Streptomyces]|uniref:DUF4158 domain-containing protein n=1 Tax=unclassified Streptomyces TaxID=2593676 RepID=UPI000D1A2218|nr:DUF4158 domain-containing protein [Streptomyces sp. TSRI0281]
MRCRPSGAHNRPVVAVQRTSVRWLGRFLPDLRQAQEEVAGYPAERLEITDPSYFEQYGERDGIARTQPGRSGRRGSAGRRRGPGRSSFQLPDLPGGLRPCATRTPPTTNQWPVAGTGRCGLWQFGSVRRWRPVPACGPARVRADEGHRGRGRPAAGRRSRAAGSACQGTVMTILPRAWPVVLAS